MTSPSIKLCAVDGCGKSAIGKDRGRRGWCQSHYERWLRHGDPRAGVAPNGAPHSWLLTTALKHKSDECLIWPFGKNSSGYGKVTIAGKHLGAHRWVCIAIHGAPPKEKNEAAHSCGNRDCVNHRHLRWATSAENHADKIAHGTSNQGAGNPRARLREIDAIEVIRRISSGESRASVAADFGITASYAGQIANRKCWQSLTQEDFT